MNFQHTFNQSRMNILSLDPHQKWPILTKICGSMLLPKSWQMSQLWLAFLFFKHVSLLTSKLVSGCYSLFMLAATCFSKKQNHQLINHVLNGIMLGIIEHNPYTYKEWWFIHDITNGETKHNDYVVSGS